MINKQQKKRREARKSGGERCRCLHLASLFLPAIIRLSVLPSPAHAGFVALIRLDVFCGAGLHLQRTSKLGAVQSYVFGGECALASDLTTGPAAEAHPPLSATARWDQASGAYTETLHLLAAGVYGGHYADNKVKVGTGREEASFKCDVDPVINRAAHCTLIRQSNATGWGGGVTDSPGKR